MVAATTTETVELAGAQGTVQIGAVNSKEAGLDCWWSRQGGKASVAGDRWLKRTPVGRTAAAGFAASWVEQESSGGGDVQLVA
jgi:hypothetical protein